MQNIYDLNYYRQKFQDTLDFLRQKNRILLITTSNRWGMEQPKSTMLAQKMRKILGKRKVTLLDITTLKIYPCEGNVSKDYGNDCGPKAALLKDHKKNPSGQHRCWSSIHNRDDELWRVSKALLSSDCVVFMGSVRWGQMNGFYQKLIERLTWLENRHATLGEANILGNIDVGLIVIGHNWHGKHIINAQKEVLRAFGFRVIDALFWNWQFTSPYDETNASYQKAFKVFKKTFAL